MTFFIWFFFLSVTLWAHKTSLGHINLIGFNFKAVVPKIVMSAFLERAPVPMLTHSELLLKISTEFNLKTKKMLNNTIRLKCCPFESSTPPGLGTSLLKKFLLKNHFRKYTYFLLSNLFFTFVFDWISLAWWQQQTLFCPDKVLVTDRPLLLWSCRMSLWLPSSSSALPHSPFIYPALYFLSVFFCLYFSVL